MAKKASTEPHLDSITYSNTRLDVARQCMKKYKFQYIDKIKVFTDQTYLLFGRCLHKISEEYQGNGKQELLELCQTYARKYNIKNEFKSKLLLALKNIHVVHKFMKSLDDIKSIEQELRITIDLNDQYKNKLLGIIDVLITFNDGSILIIDYKTNKSKKYSNYGNQIALYMHVIHKKYNIPYEKMSNKLFYVALEPEEKDGTKVLNEGIENITSCYSLDNTDVEMLLEEIQSIDNKLRKAMISNKWKSNPNWFNCTFCDYSEHCDEKYVNPEN